MDAGGPRTKQDHRTRVGEERSARTETRILEAAFTVFAEMGPDAPKIDDVVRAAGVSRGTFYNYFESVDALLATSSERTTRDALETIHAALEGIEGPALRLGVGLRLYFAMARADPVWCRFVARVWRFQAFEPFERDVEAGLRLGVFRAPNVEAATDVLLACVRGVLLRMGHASTPPGYGSQVTAVCLQALGTDPRRIAAVLRHPLPSMPPHPTKHHAKGGLRR